MTNSGWFNTRGQRLFGWLMCMLFVFSAPAALASARLFDHVAVSEEVLDELRGGFFTDNGQEMSFAITRTVSIDGQVVLMQTLVLNNIPALLSQATPSVEGATGTLAVVQNGLGNAIDAAANAVSRAAAGAVTSESASKATPSAVSVSPATADIAAAVSNTGNVSKATAASNPPPSNPPSTVPNTPTVATVQLPSLANSPAAAQPVAPSSKATAASDPPPLTVSNAPSVATVHVQPPASGPAAAQSAANGSASLTTQIVAGGQTIVIPNGPAMAAAIQNSVNNTRIQVKTDISATMATLSQLGALLRQQAAAAGPR